MLERSDQLVCRRCGREFDYPEQSRLPGMEDPPAELCAACAAPEVLEVAVSVLGNRAGSYVLEDGVLRWEGLDGTPEVFGDYRQVIDGREMRRAILAEDRPNTWIVPEDDPERWLRRVPGFCAMRGIVTAEIVRDVRRRKERSHA